MRLTQNVFSPAYPHRPLYPQRCGSTNPRTRRCCSLIPDRRLSHQA
jgi:hypothetical protein